MKALAIYHYIIAAGILSLLAIFSQYQVYQIINYFVTFIIVQVNKDIRRYFEEVFSFHLLTLPICPHYNEVVCLITFLKELGSPR